MEAANSARPLPHFDYVPTAGCEPSHRQGIMIGTRLRQPGQAAAPSRGRRLSPPLPPLLMRLTPAHNAQKYCEFHEQYGHTTTKCRQVKKALHELADKRDEEYSTEVMAAIAGGYAEGMTRSTWKAHLRGAQQVLTTEQGPHITVPTMVFGGKEALRFASPHNDPLVVEMKIASAIIRRILINTGSSVDIITWDCLKKLTNPGCDIVPLRHPI
ncbi:hypothetical protein Cgig2_020902 [Carnegiea gigantea]|uniref:Retrotransposon gag domain-containing protein n=1 Tax=Carnegiea gigantea TaxID=171969 RepID=A0A9Q1GM73_9CARY|nr:hypothetical protein Cgig2_020902 [Carnegiea gigantea]